MSAPAPTEEKTEKFVRWHHRVLGICLALFAFELGLVLVMFPWIKSWDLSSIPLQWPWMEKIWMSSYFRGALSGLGLLNIYIGIVELVRQLGGLFRRR